MIHTRVGLLVGMLLLIVAMPISATPSPDPLFNECPQTGRALGCSYLLEIGSGGTLKMLSDPSIKDIDTHDDILIGIQNDSPGYIYLKSLSGPNNLFSGFNLTGGLWSGKYTYIEIKDPFEKDDGKDDGDDDDSGHTGVTPEPSSLALLGTGLVFLGGIVRRRFVS